MKTIWVRVSVFVSIHVVMLATVLTVASARADILYDPPVGSKWQIVSNTTTSEIRPGAGNRDEKIETHSELTINEKLPDGFFRITYITRSIEVTGNAPATKLVADAYGAMRDIPVRARLDKAGRPVEVENLAEIKKTMREVVDKITAKFDANPKAAAVIRQMFEPLTKVEGRDAAITYLEDLPQLAAVQNIGLQPGQIRKDTETNPSPFGNVSFKTNVTTRLDNYDEKTGAARFVRKREYDKESLRDAVTDIVRKLAAAGDNKTITTEMVDMMKKINFSIDGETIYNVDKGMTVWIDDREFTTASVMGTTFTKQQKKTVAVTRQN